MSSRFTAEASSSRARRSIGVASSTERVSRTALGTRAASSGMSAFGEVYADAYDALYGDKTT